MNIPIISLPLDIFYNIQQFTSINALLNTSKSLDDVKHRLFCWKLNQDASEQFRSNRIFRNHLLGLLHDIRKQLSLKPPQTREEELKEIKKKMGTCFCLIFLFPPTIITYIVASGKNDYTPLEFFVHFLLLMGALFIVIIS
jgi:hypothetical protein